MSSPSVAAPGGRRRSARRRTTGGSNVDDYMWIPIVGPFVGGLIGAYVYDLTTHDVLVARGETADLDVEQRGRTVEETG
jgi:hypothetical protein